MVTRARRRKDRLTPSQARAARRTRRQRRRRLVRYGGFSLIGAIAFIFILGLFLPSIPITGGGGIFGRSAPDGPGVKIEDQGATHISLGESHAPYSSAPATSGWHYGQPLAPVRWGLHDEVVADEHRLHNLEHGGIGVHYNCPDGCPELVAQLTAIVERSRDEGLKVLLSPYPGIETTIALTAWRFIDRFDVFDEERVKAFISAHESSPNAPEPNAG
ncbi:MAG: DUF3105 domain-containing protein [Chloroflexi bacterium]|nr:DUF3105 domain-containing protein [Chloroflexota bacterium]